jgi:hypothetical protein
LGRREAPAFRTIEVRIRIGSSHSASRAVLHEVPWEDCADAWSGSGNPASTRGVEKSFSSTFDFSSIGTAMLTTAVCAVAALWISGLVILLVSARRALVGEEDENGFRVVTDAPE